MKRSSAQNAMGKAERILAGDVRGEADGGESQEVKGFGRSARFVGARESRRVTNAMDAGGSFKIEHSHGGQQGASTRRLFRCAR